MDGEQGGSGEADAARVLRAADRKSGSYDPGRTPTDQQYEAFDAAFDHFNAALFAKTLPAVLLTFSRKSRARGFFVAERWQPAETVEQARVHEIALNPDHLSREPRDVASTIVHEMVHLWQQAFGKPSRRAYHNAEWARKMESIGLVPSSSGRPGGKKTGQSVTHYIVEGGAFDLAWTRLASNTLLPLMTARGNECQRSKRTKQLASKTKFVCSACSNCAWGKPDLRIVCGACNEPMPASVGPLTPAEG